MNTQELEILIKDLSALPKECEWAEFKVNKDYDTESKSRKYAKYVPYWF